MIDLALMLQYLLLDVGSVRAPAPCCRLSDRPHPAEMNTALCCLHNPLQVPVVRCASAAAPDSDAARQNTSMGPL